MENYFESQRETIFQNAEVLIYVLVASPTEKRGERDPRPGGGSGGQDLNYFARAMESLRQSSPNARVFCLVHKLDLVHESKREEVMDTWRRDLTNAAPGMNLQCFGTSIWDETLFKAWSHIVANVVPDVNQLEKQLEHICRICEADEVVLFERNTFLLISSSSRRSIPDSHRFEKISNIVKQFKLSCGKVKTNFRSFQVRNSLFSATIEPFLNHSFVMVVVSDPSIHAAATSANLWAARTHFAELAKAGAAFGQHL
jgi:Ras-related GTP-binding protein A/B